MLSFFKKRPPLVKAADNGDLYEVLELMKKDSSLIHDKDEGEMTALHLASKNGHSNVVMLLLLGGLDFDLKNTASKSALDLAMDANQTSIIEIHANCSDPKRKNNYLIQELIKSGGKELKLELFEFFIDKMELSDYDFMAFLLDAISKMGQSERTRALAMLKSVTAPILSVFKRMHEEFKQVENAVNMMDEKIKIVTAINNEEQTRLKAVIFDRETKYNELMTSTDFLATDVKRERDIFSENVKSLGNLDDLVIGIVGEVTKANNHIKTNLHFQLWIRQFPF
eukprot:TRINITY_DN9943_c0_g1_i1.p1 TRINITY_DN9943_c0_g1~~TRINITY_DN9943_c0_g1_i1.p1  ORF type:complete len:282 (+),score=86.06 TRINITY_DN9943_c0_g1_i1:95-940(+)